MRLRISLAAFASAVAVLYPPPAVGHQPYGGCDEAWQAPRSIGATHCREHRWIVRPRVVIDPKGWVRAMRLPPCRAEDEIRCYWDAKTMGNGVGDSFVWVGTRERHRLIYVRGFRCGGAP